MARVVPSRALDGLLRVLVTWRANALAPADALRFLFRLDAVLYALQGTKAIEYGGGLHTKHRHTRYHDFFISRIESGERVLDIGCGNGALSAEIARKKNVFVLGVDANEQSIMEARRQYPGASLQFRVANALDPFPKEPFDVVVLSNVLEHLPERSTFLSRIWNEVKPRRILVRVPLWERDWRVPLRQELGVEWRLDPDHKIEYTQESFADEVAQAGLEIVYLEVRWGEIWAELARHRARPM